jgi:predicted nuclease of predicted toxin-antitoxin system
MPWKPILIPSGREADAVVRHQKKRARLLVDESLGPAVAEVLRGAGWNMKFAGEVGLLGRSDEDVLAYAQRDDRFLLTHDVEFLDDRRFPPDHNPRILVLSGASGECCREP